MITRAICVHSKMIGVNAEVFIYILSLVNKLLCPEWDGFTLVEIDFHEKKIQIYLFYEMRLTHTREAKYSSTFA